MSHNSELLDIALDKLEALTKRVEAQDIIINQLKRVTEMQAEALRMVSGDGARQAVHVMAGIFGGLAHQLEHAAHEAAQTARAGGLTYKEVTQEEANHLTVLVTRNGDQINFSMAETPDQIENTGMDPIAKRMLTENFIQDGERKLINLEQEVQDDRPIAVETN